MKPRTAETPEEIAHCRRIRGELLGAEENARVSVIFSMKNGLDLKGILTGATVLPEKATGQNQSEGGLIEVYFTGEPVGARWVDILDIDEVLLVPI